MGKKIILKESELVALIKNIAEQVQSTQPAIALPKPTDENQFSMAAQTLMKYGWKVVKNVEHFKFIAQLNNTMIKADMGGEFLLFKNGVNTGLKFYYKNEPYFLKQLTSALTTIK